MQKITKCPPAYAEGYAKINQEWEQLESIALSLRQEEPEELIFDDKE